jgi:hypothetical protein
MIYRGQLLKMYNQSLNRKGAKKMYDKFLYILLMFFAFSGLIFWTGLVLLVWYYWLSYEDRLAAKDMEET